MPASSSKDPRAVELGKWLQEQRLARGLKRPEAVKQALFHVPHAALSPDYLSKLEYGDRSLAAAALEVREALRAGLGITRADWESSTGLHVPADPSQPTHVLTPTKPARPRHEIPDELQQAIKMFGDRYPDLQQDDWQQYLASFRDRSIEADTPEDWLAFYRNLVRYGVKPGDPT